MTGQRFVIERRTQPVKVFDNKDAWVLGDAHYYIDGQEVTYQDFKQHAPVALFAEEGYGHGV